MKKIKKVVIFIGIIIFCIVSISIYFMPLPLSNLANENNVILMINVNAGVKDGTPFTDSQSYNDITKEQQKEIVTLFEEYTYHRKLNTMFSDGSLSTGNNTSSFYIFVYDGLTPTNTIILTDYDNNLVNNKNYSINKSSDLVEQILAIINK